MLGKEGQELKARVRPELLLLLFITQRGPGEDMLGGRQGQGLRTGASGPRAPGRLQVKMLGGHLDIESGAPGRG